MTLKNRFSLYILAATFLTAGLSAQDNLDPLVSAYQKEFVFLDNEIRLLKERIEEVNADGDSRVRSSERELERLEEELLALGVLVERKADDLRLLEEERNTSEDANDTIASIVNQANSRLRNFSIPVFDKGESEEDDPAAVGRELKYVFSESLGLLTSLSGRRIESGKFFMPDGKEVEGQIVRIGQIASFGSDGNVGGTLIPAGGGLLRLDNTDNHNVAKKLLAGNEPDELPIFLYESLDNLVETSKGKTLSDTIEGGGFIGLIIIGLGFAALILIIFRAFILRKSGEGATADVEEIAEKVEKRRLDDASALTAAVPGALGRVLSNTIDGLRTDPEKVEDTIAETVMNEQPALDRFRIPLSVFAAVAPLLGLLGTVTGMIATFDIITVYGTGDPKLLSGGISEALITTQLGLMVAIPTLLIGNLLSSWANSITSTLEVKALRMVNAFTGNKAEV